MTVSRNSVGFLWRTTNPKPSHLPPSKRLWIKWGFSEKDSKTYKITLWLPWRRDGEFGMVVYTLLYFKWITNKDLLYNTWNSAQCYMAAWMGVEFGGEWISVRVCSAVPLLFTWNYHNTVNQLDPNTKLKVKKKKKNTQMICLLNKITKIE